MRLIGTLDGNRVIVEMHRSEYDAIACTVEVGQPIISRMSKAEVVAWEKEFSRGVHRLGLPMRVQNAILRGTAPLLNPELYESDSSYQYGWPNKLEIAWNVFGDGRGGLLSFDEWLILVSKHIAAIRELREFGKVAATQLLDAVARYQKAS